MIRLAVTADDRSGAMESAALGADAGLTTVVVSWDGDPAPAGVDCAVVDLRTRHLTPERAANRAASVPLVPGARRVHKIDSTLRGNWAAEVLAVAGRVLLVPSYPAAGRTCEGGLVLVDGVPVAETEFGRDPSAPVRSSRPSESLGAVELSTAAQVALWVGGDGRSAVADAATDRDLAEVVAAAMAAPDVLVAGPAAVVGAVANLIGPGTPGRPVLPPGDVLVVRGSRHAASRAQAAAVALVPGVTVVEPPEGWDGDPEIVALELATRAHDLLGARRFGLVVLLGGDTADAFLGERAVHVLGSVGVGMAYGTLVVGGRALGVVTKPGGFGATNALVDLLTPRPSR
jgi:uncharacterized protein YgbK (DUF1537 family)